MKKLALAVSAAALFAIPAAPAAAAQEIPEINCGIVSCTHPIDETVDYARYVGGQVVDCVRGTANATWQALNGIYGMYDCSIG